MSCELRDIVGAALSCKEPYAVSGPCRLVKGAKVIERLFQPKFKGANFIRLKVDFANLGPQQIFIYDRANEEIWRQYLRDLEQVDLILFNELPAIVIANGEKFDAEDHPAIQAWQNKNGEYFGYGFSIFGVICLLGVFSRSENAP